MNASALGHDARTGLRFLAETLCALAVLAAASFAARHAPVMPGTPAYTAVQLLPIPGVWLLLLAALRHYLRIDELQRLRFLQAIALTGGILVGVFWSMPFLQRAFGWTVSDDGSWEVYFSVIFVVVTAFIPKLRAR